MERLDRIKGKYMVVDADLDLMANPEGTLKQICAFSSIMLSKNMLSWERRTRFLEKVPRLAHRRRQLNGIKSTSTERIFRASRLSERSVHRRRRSHAVLYFLHKKKMKRKRSQ